MIHRAHQVDQFLVDDADELLRGIERLEHRLANGLLGDAGDEVLGHGEADVGLQQGRLHQGEPFAHVRLGQPAASAEGLDRRTKVFLKGFEHIRQKALGEQRGLNYPPSDRRGTWQTTPKIFMLVRSLFAAGSAKRIRLRGAESHILTNSRPVWQSSWHGIYFVTSRERHVDSTHLGRFSLRGPRTAPG